MHYYAKSRNTKNLLVIAEYLKKENFLLSKNFNDGRINASINEDEILKIIKKKFKIEVPKMRSWFDFSVEVGKKFYPVNIKITDTTHADNLNCKLGIYYAFTGRFPNFPNEVSWLKYFENLKNDMQETSEDYYFLVINKNDSQDIFINTLKSLKTLQPNGNNLPFQCKWDVNKIPVFRSYEESKEFILSTFGKSIKLRAEIYFIFKRLFNEYA